MSLPTLDLGCANTKRGDIGIDIVGPPITAADYVVNLGFQPIPLPDSSIGRVVAHHFVEHVPATVYIGETSQTGGLRGDGEWIVEPSMTRAVTPLRPLMYLFDEVWRVLAPAGEFYVETPRFPSPQAVCDPQHVSFWHENSITYYSGDYVGHRNTYGHGSRFESMGWAVDDGWLLRFTLRAIKGLPAAYPFKLEYTDDERAGIPSDDWVSAQATRDDVAAQG